MALEAKVGDALAAGPVISLPEGELGRQLELDRGPRGADLECDNGADDDSDGLIDALDPQCGGPFGIERLTACNNGLDDDGDGLADIAGGDPGCDWVGDEDEHGGWSCDDGFDDDGDGLVDLTDPGCPDVWGSEWNG